MQYGGPKGKVPKLDDRLKELMQELGNAINESLSESDRIASAIGDIKRSGYDVFLVLEATIGFNKRDRDADGDGDGDSENDSGSDQAGGERTTFESAGTVKWTSQDAKFLKALRISMEEDR